MPCQPWFWGLAGCWPSWICSAKSPSDRGPGDVHDESSRRALETCRPPPLFAPVGARTDHIQNPPGAANLAVRTPGTLSGDAASASRCESRTTLQRLLEWLYQSRARTPGERTPAAPGGSAARATHSLPGSLRATAAPA